MDAQAEAVGRAVGEALKAGLSVLFPKEDGSKAPDVVSWKEYQQRRADRDELRGWFGTGRRGIYVVCGAVSGGLLCFDFETEKIYGDALTAAALAGLEDLVEAIESGYCEACPRGGRHWLIRTDFRSSNRKLALDENCETMIEIRGEGGGVITAPSFRPVHAEGDYVLLSGGFSTIASVSFEDCEALIQAFTNLDRSPKQDDHRVWAPPSAASEDDPGRDFNVRGDWHEEVLKPAGWTWRGGIGTQEYWGRPGKDWSMEKGHSAVLHTDSSLLVPFSTSTPLPVTEVGYSKWRALAFLRFEGDFSATARWLLDQGYGKRRVREEKKTWTPPVGGWTSGSDLFDMDVPEVSTLPVLGRDGFVLQGGTNLLYAYPKTGKTELTRELVWEWRGLGLNVAYYTEEALWMWRPRLELYDEPREHWSGVAFRAAHGWGIGQVVEAMPTRNVDVVIVDTLRNTCAYEEGKGDQDVLRVVLPLIGAVRDRGATLLALYHARKMPGDGGRDISGHHALYGAFDRAIQLKEVPGEDNVRKRRLEVSGRMLDPMGDNRMTYTLDDRGRFRALDGLAIVGKTKVCEYCREEFQAKRSTARFCSDGCRDRKYRGKDSSTDSDFAKDHPRGGELSEVTESERTDDPEDQ